MSRIVVEDAGYSPRIRRDGIMRIAVCRHRPALSVVQAFRLQQDAEDCTFFDEETRGLMG